MEIVKYVLQYDRRCVIRNGELIIIHRLDVNKYRNIIYLLNIKPKIEHCFALAVGIQKWDTYRVRFSNDLGIRYNISYMGVVDTIHYMIGKNKRYGFTPSWHLNMP